MTKVITIRIDLEQLATDYRHYVNTQLADDVRVFVQRLLALPDAYHESAVKVKAEAQ